MKEITNSDLFYCYNKRLSDHLFECGLTPLTIAINPKSKNIFSLYQKTNELQQAIDKYKRIYK
ncbi:hypothetical protein [Aquibacillus saliphilus]|uniref:hypothetical protein n=1 Tax=Aquibacillus saliphilus TaxID=1909422 RepID=UPI001CF09AFD|nr:hypothetical protein [Aquibacillus saliphilus]